VSAEQRKAALKKVAEELDEAEEIVRILRPGSVSSFDNLLFSLGRANGSRAPFHACVNPTELPRQTSGLPSWPGESKEELGTLQDFPSRVLLT